MPIPPIGVATAGANTAQPPRAPKQTLDGEVFLHLLVTQLANQDPSSPMDTNAMISQTTQLASMEKLNMLSDTQDVSLGFQQRTAVASLIGTEVTTGGDNPVTGVVTGVSFAGYEPVLTIGDKQVPYGQVVSIRQVQGTPETPDVPPTPEDPETPEVPETPDTGTPA